MGRAFSMAKHQRIHDSEDDGTYALYRCLRMDVGSYFARRWEPLDAPFVRT
jgi:hypothetical protein